MSVFIVESKHWGCIGTSIRETSCMGEIVERVGTFETRELAEEYIQNINPSSPTDWNGNQLSSKYKFYITESIIVK